MQKKEVIDTEEVTRKEDLEEFKGLMEEVAELPKQQMDKVSYFAQGVLAMAGDKKGAR